MPASVGTYKSIRRLFATAALIAAIGSLGVTMFSPAGWAQTQAVAANAGEKLSNEQLDELVGPIALYPDELLAIVLPASTFPLEVVQAARFLEKRKKDPDLKPRESWDSSVLGLLNYPEVVDQMNQDLDWASQLGDTVINQQQDLMDAVQRFRAQAHAAGNLESDKQTTIIRETEIIKIESATPEVIYVPAYNPSVVVVHQPAPYAYVYSSPYPYYHSPAAAFWTGMFVGGAIGYGIGWHGHGHNDININRNVNVNRNQNLNVNRNQNLNVNRGSGTKWNPNRQASGSVSRPGTRSTARPGTRSGVSSRPTSQTRRDLSTQPSRDRRGSVSGGGQVRRPQGRSGQVSRQQSRGGSFGSYQSGRSARTTSNRGQQSRSSRSSNRTSRGSGSGSRGGRGGRR